MESRGLGGTAEKQHLARRTARMTRAAKRDVDREALRETWARQATESRLRCESACRFSVGVEKGDERQVVGVDHEHREVVLDGGECGPVRWKPGEIAGRRGGSEVYKVEGSSSAPATASG